MIGSLLASLVYPLGSVLTVGSLAAFGVAALFVRATASVKGERYRRAGLGLLAVLGGPLIGVALAGLAHALGGIHPADIDYTYIKFASIGGIAGFITGLIFAMTSALSSNRNQGFPRNPIR